MKSYYKFCSKEDNYVGGHDSLVFRTRPHSMDSLKLK